MKQFLPSLIPTVGAIVVAGVIGWTILHRNDARYAVNVVGLGQQDFESDLVVWQGEFIRESSSLEQAYAQLQRDREIATRFLQSRGVTPEQMRFSSVSIIRQYTSEYDHEGRVRGERFSGYRLVQSVRIESRDLDRIESIARDVGEIIKQGVEFNSSMPQYFYTKLDSLKIALIAAATADARRRAETIAARAGSRLGRLQAASLGVFQITERNSTEELEWGGTFNTTARAKTARVTVRLWYGL